MECSQATGSRRWIIRFVVGSKTVLIREKLRGSPDVVTYHMYHVGKGPPRREFSGSIKVNYFRNQAVSSRVLTTREKPGIRVIVLLSGGVSDKRTSEADFPRRHCSICSASLRRIHTDGTGTILIFHPSAHLPSISVRTYYSMNSKPVPISFFLSEFDNSGSQFRKYLGSDCYHVIPRMPTSLYPPPA